MNHCTTGTSAFALIVGMMSTPAMATDLYEAPAPASVAPMESWSGFYSGRHIGGVFGQDQNSRSATVNGGNGDGGGGNGQQTRLTLRTLGESNA